MQNFDPQNVQKFTSADAEDWMEYSGFALADVVNEDEAPQAKLGALGFTRSPKGAKSQFDFAYDEVMVVTKGRCTVRSRDRKLTAGPGEALYSETLVRLGRAFLCYRPVETAPAVAPLPAGQHGAVTFGSFTRPR